jgi:hypothetical protein
VLYGFPMNLIEDASLIMSLMHLDYRFNASLLVLYFLLLLLYHVLLAQLMWHPIGPCHPLILPSVFLSFYFWCLCFCLLFPFGCDCCLSSRQFCVSNFVWIFFLWHPMPSLRGHFLRGGGSTILIQLWSAPIDHPFAFFT